MHIYLDKVIESIFEFQTFFRPVANTMIRSSPLSLCSQTYNGDLLVTEVIPMRQGGGIDFKVLFFTSTPNCNNVVIEKSKMKKDK